MSTSRRAKRMERHHQRSKKTVGLNLVSLMDIFTILVFFLLVNTAEVELLPNVSSITLPDSVADRRSQDSVVLVITPEYLLIDNKNVITRQAATDNATPVIEPLKTALSDTAAKLTRNELSEDAPAPELTIMADKQLPYKLIKKLMATGGAAGYSEISLAVLQKATKAQE